MKSASTYMPGKVVLIFMDVTSSSQNPSEVGTIPTSSLEKKITQERLNHLPKVTQHVNC